MGAFAKQWLHRGFATAQCVETDAVNLQIDLGANQAVRPQRVNRRSATQQAGCSLLVSAARIDDPALWRRRKIRTPADGKGPARGRSVDALGRSGARGSNIGFGTGSKAG